MGDGSSLSDILGILAVFLLVFANGFFVAAEFALVSVRRSRVAELVAAKRVNALSLQTTLNHLDLNLAATQLGVTISSLGLGWIGEPALAHLIEPLFSALPRDWMSAGSHAISVAISFIIITALHIVLGELAPKSLALQRTERTALFVVGPLNVFQFVLRPAIIALNTLGNMVLRIVGLQAGKGEESRHSPEELKLLVAASRKAGLLQEAQQEVLDRVFNIGQRRIGDIMTPRVDLDWIDLDDKPDDILKSIRECRHEQLLAGRGNIDEPLGMVSKKELLDQVLDGGQINAAAALREPLVVHESTPVFRVLEQFKRAPVRLALVVDEYGSLEGIVTQTDLLEAIAGDLAATEDDTPDIVERADGSLLIEGMMPAHEAFERLGVKDRPEEEDYHTLAGFALHQLEHLPEVGEEFSWDGWRFEIVDMDGRRIDKLLATRESESKSL
ncbi:hemolysin family protein [Beijerinckia indica]|uniref:Hemolysin n=1 Tax=Beijerinckia indica subsp. indica (strain ATCC 9039 / DSM 1715 / NCIMB 8712) TaxID=395963 RepID=B2IGU1_BEII9|nr:hemolysin family protein [Beijerinckia indica]ACB95852.1 protein of unknown function DUF21 [Beijerinckia indica subsp. indica ATCC 9039]